MKNLKKLELLVILVFAISITNKSYSQEIVQKSLVNEFKVPPNEAKPRVWWHWMNGNISRDGIRKDLEWMNRIGIGGFQNFDANLTTPKIVEERLTYMTPKWKDAFKFTTHLADSLGLEMAIAASPGWSETGGPWVEPKDGMKKVVWSESRISRGKKYKGKLPHPPTTSGTFQNVPFDNAQSILGKTPEPPEYYEDIAVIAYKVPEIDVPIIDFNPKITSSTGEKFDINQLNDGNLDKSTYLSPTEVGKYSWLQYEFENNITITSLKISTGEVQGYSLGPVAETRNFEVSDDGKNFKKVMDLPLGKIAHKTFTFPPVTAKFFRFNFLTKAPPKPNPIMALFGISPEPSVIKGTDIAELSLSSFPYINNFEEKAAYSIVTDLYEKFTPSISHSIGIEDILDITSNMKPDGSLEWDAPAGNWNILRFGYTLTGRHNHPASPEATGLEVDKLDPVAVRDYIENYLDQYMDATGGLMGDKGGLGYIITDSWEAATSNWTNKMMVEFEKRRGYNMLPWLPTLAGKVVKNAESSDGFLWDFRATLEEMVKEYHYDVLSEVLHARGMKRYTESHEHGRRFIADGMAIKSTADIPMSATWIPGMFNRKNFDEPAVVMQADVRESASTAHLYGQKFVAAESLTSLGNPLATFSPENLKPTVDMELACGLNRFVIHTSVHQPVDDKFPGLTLGPFGQWFTRHETWAEQAKAWTAYLSRSSYMLQQGTFVADILYYYGEDNNITALFEENLPNIPDGYSYDFINPDALINLLSVKDGKIITPSGMSYQILVLDKNNKFMSLEVLKKIQELVNSGAVITGQKPVATPSLSDDKEEFSRIVNELWNEGNKNVYANLPLNDVLDSLKLVPDFQYKKPKEDSKLLFVHRKLEDADFYWVNNRRDRVEEVEASFRMHGREVEIWNPETGGISKISYKTENGITKVPLLMQPHDAFFVVFNGNTDKKEFSVVAPTEEKLVDIDGSWDLNFQPERGAPEHISLDKLMSLSEHDDNGVKYFSGTVTYTKNLNISKKWIKGGDELCIDLGEVKNLAEVFVNGKSQQIVWKKPFRANITNGLKAGDNKLEIKVTNVWANRLIGDLQPDVKQKITYTTMPFYSESSPYCLPVYLGRCNW